MSFCLNWKIILIPDSLFAFPVFLYKITKLNYNCFKLKKEALYAEYYTGDAFFYYFNFLLIAGQP
jgi:hypothetical protein